MSGVSIKRFIDAARAVESPVELTVDEFADACWLAERLPLRGDQEMSERHDRPPPELPSGEDSQPDLIAPEQPQASDDSPAAGKLSAGSRQPETDPPGSLGGILLRAPALPVLPARLALSRALRPLKRKVPSRTVSELDEHTTACRAADSGMLLPVFRPAHDRWLELAVVVDESPTMAVWSPTIDDFVRLAGESGAFRDLRVWRCRTDVPAGRPLRIAGQGRGALQGRDPRELVDPAGRRIILVISDCVGAAWSDVRMAELLGQWASTGPVAILQPLPERMWPRCAPKFTPVDLRSPEPASPTARLDRAPVQEPEQQLLASYLGVAAEPEDTDAGDGVAIPVVRLSGRWLSRWAALVAGGDRRWHRSVAIYTSDPVRIIDAQDSTAHPAITSNSDDRVTNRVLRFRAQSSPQAFRLATLLAAAPLRLPVMRLVQQVLTPYPQPAHLAEVLLGGLLRRTSPMEPALDPDEVDYDFEDGIRGELLRYLTRSDALRVLADTSTFVAKQIGAPLDFLAYLSGGSDDEVPVLDPRSAPLARVAWHVLRALGGVYAEEAEILRSRLREADDPRTTDPLDSVPSSGARIERNGDDVASSPSRMPAAPDLPTGERPTAIRFLPKRNPTFTGRRILLANVREVLLNPSRSAVLVPGALYGEGGVGKTQIALEYAHRFADEYQVVWWIPAEDPAEIRRSLVELAVALKLPVGAEASKTLETLQETLRDRKKCRSWLLIFDNAGTPDDLRGYLPQKVDHGHILITSREHAWSVQEGGKTLQVDVFSREESTSLLQRRGPGIEGEEADRVAGVLDDLPLALDMLAAWKAETGGAVTDFLRQFADRAAELDKQRLPGRPPVAAAATISFVFDWLRGNAPGPAYLLQVCAHYSAEPVSVDMLWRGRHTPGLPPSLSRVLLDRTPLRRALTELERYSLVKYDQARGRFQVHRIVQAVVRRGLDPEQGAAVARYAHGILAMANPGNPDDLPVEERFRHAEISPHIGPSGVIRSEDMEARRVVLDQIRYRYLVGDYESSRDLAREVVAVWTDRWGLTDELTLLARRHLSNTTRALGEVIAARTLDEETLELFTEHFGEDHEHSLATANSLGADLRAVGAFREAMELDARNLARHQRTLGVSDPATLRTANNYAVDLRQIGDFDGARRLDEDTLQRRRDLYGGDHPTTLFAISNLVRDLYGLGDYEAALRMQEEALTVHESVLTAGHPDVMLARRTVAALYRKLGRYKMARDLSRTNLLAYETRFGKNHENTLAARMTYSNALRADDRRTPEDLAEAKRYAEGALTRYQESFPGHPFVEVCKVNLAIVLRHLGEVAAARDLNQEASQALATRLGEHHPYRLCCLANLSNDLSALRDYDAARQVSEVAAAGMRAVYGDRHPYTLACLSNSALDLRNTGNADLGDNLLAEAVRGFLDRLGSGHPDTVSAQQHRRLDCDIEPPPT